METKPIIFKLTKISDNPNNIRTKDVIGYSKLFPKTIAKCTSRSGNLVDDRVDYRRTAGPELATTIRSQNRYFGH